MAVLTVSTVVSGLGGAISNIASGALQVLKIVASVAFASIFMVAISSLIGLIESVVMGSLVGEVLALLSVSLPINPVVPFTTLNVCFISILSFLVAKKIYELTSNLISVSGH